MNIFAFFKTMKYPPHTHTHMCVLTNNTLIRCCQRDVIGCPSLRDFGNGCAGICFKMGCASYCCCLGWSCCGLNMRKNAMNNNKVFFLILKKHISSKTVQHFKQMIHCNKIAKFTKHLPCKTPGQKEKVSVR